MRILLGAASAVVIVAGARAISTVVIPVVFALFLTLTIYPLVAWLQAHGVRRPLAITATLAVVVAALVGPAMLLATAIRQFAMAVPTYERQLRQILAGVFAWLRERNVDTTSLTSLADPVRVLDLTVVALTNIVTLLSFALLVIVVTAFMLVEATHVVDRRHRVLPEGLKGPLARIAKEMQGWLLVKTLVSALTGLAAGLWSAALGIDFAVLWGLVAFLFNYIPNLGSFVAAWPPALLALIQFGPLMAGVVLFGYAVINVAFGNFLEPYLTGRRVGLSPLVVLVAVIAWGWMWGVAGMLLSVPITMAIKIGLEQSDELRWLAILLGSGAEDTGRRGPAPSGVEGAEPAAEPAHVSSR